MNTQEKIKALEEITANLKAGLNQKKDWPQIGDKYWTFYSSGKVDRFVSSNDTVDKKLIKSHMMFRTEKEATLARDQGLAYRKLWELADGGRWIISKHHNEYLAMEFGNYYGTPKFSTEGSAMEAVAEIGEELLDTIFDQGET